MQCHAIVLGTTGMTYTFYKREKREGTKKKKKKTKGKIKLQKKEGKSLASREQKQYKNFSF